MKLAVQSGEPEEGQHKACRKDHGVVLCNLAFEAILRTDACKQTIDAG
jgi:hypothetical protein